jgi:hypothetical protein
MVLMREAKKKADAVKKADKIAAKKAAKENDTLIPVEPDVKENDI